MKKKLLMLFTVILLVSVFVTAYPVLTDDDDDDDDKYIAREEIKEIVANYFWAVDMKDIDDLMALFHEEAVVTDIYGTPYEGKKIIKAMFLFTFDLYPHSKHIYYPVVVKVGGRETTATFRAMFSIDGTGITMWGIDEFTFKEEKGIWKIIKLDISLWPN